MNICDICSGYTHMPEGADKIIRCNTCLRRKYYRDNALQQRKQGTDKNRATVHVDAPKEHSYKRSGTY